MFTTVSRTCNNSAYIIVEDRHGKFHCRYHHMRGYVFGDHGLGCALLKNFPNEAATIFLININKNFQSITYKISDIEKIGGAYADCLVQYGENIIVATNDALQGFDNLKDVLKGCNCEFIYLFSQADKKWSMMWENKLHIELAIVYRIGCVFKDFIDDVGRNDNKIKSLFHGSKNSANMCLEINNILKMDNYKDIIGFMSNSCGHRIDINNIVEEVKILNIHDGLNKKISMLHKEMSSERRYKI